MPLRVDKSDVPSELMWKAAHENAEGKKLTCVMIVQFAFEKGAQLEKSDLSQVLVLESYW